MTTYRILMKNRVQQKWTSIRAASESLARVLVFTKFPSCYGWTIERVEA